LGEFYEGPPWCLFYSKLWLTLGDSATGNEVNDDGDVVTGDDNNNGDHNGDSDGNGNDTMGSVAAGYNDNGDDDGDGRDDNDATTTMATAHQAGYYALLILNWKKMFDTMATSDDLDDQRQPTKTASMRMATARRATKLR
jgi:hypothetical protein